MLLLWGEMFRICLLGPLGPLLFISCFLIDLLSDGSVHSSEWSIEISWDFMFLSVPPFGFMSASLIEEL